MNEYFFEVLPWRKPGDKGFQIYRLDGRQVEYDQADPFSSTALAIQGRERGSLTDFASDVINSWQTGPVTAQMFEQFDFALFEAKSNQEALGIPEPLR
jgi:hypothetical protein